MARPDGAACAKLVGTRPRPQELSYDLWWRLGFDTMVTSEGRLYDW
jgi:hypothetical protein